MLKIKGLKKQFGGVKAVDGCTFQVKQGKINALIGPNGSGKTTTFNVISGILKADSGEIFFYGKEITNLSPEKISNLGISRLFQESRLFKNLTVKENLVLAFGREDTHFWKNLFGFIKDTKEKEDKVKEILKLVGMQKFEDHLARNLSYGQKRLIAILRAVINPHKLLMLDEPVTGVTPRLRKEISKLLLKLNRQGETIFLIEHDMNFTLNLADEVVVMDKGRIIARGKPNAMKKNKKVIEAYLGEENV